MVLRLECLILKYLYYIKFYFKFSFSEIFYNVPASLTLSKYLTMALKEFPWAVTITDFPYKIAGQIAVFFKKKINNYLKI